MSVVSIEQEREARRLIWVCPCGCTVFRCYEDGQLECPECDVPVTGFPGEWRARLPEVPAIVKPMSSGNFKVVRVDTASIWLKRISQAVADGEVVMGLILFADGTSSCWSDRSKLIGKNQVAWLRRKLRSATSHLMKGE